MRSCGGWPATRPSLWIPSPRLWCPHCKLPVLPGPQGQTLRVALDALPWGRSKLGSFLTAPQIFTLGKDKCKSEFPHSLPRSQLFRGRPSLSQASCWLVQFANLWLLILSFTKKVRLSGASAHTLTHSPWYTHTLTWSYLLWHTHILTHSNSDTLTLTCSNARSDTLIPWHTHTLTQSFLLWHTFYHAHTLTQSFLLWHTLWHTLWHNHSSSDTHSDIIILTLTHTDTLTLWHNTYSGTLSLWHTALDLYPWSPGEDRNMNEWRMLTLKNYSLT